MTSIIQQQQPDTSSLLLTSSTDTGFGTTCLSRNTTESDDSGSNNDVKTSPDQPLRSSSPIANPAAVAAAVSWAARDLLKASTANVIDNSGGFCFNQSPVVGNTFQASAATVPSAFGSGGGVDQFATTAGVKRSFDTANQINQSSFLTTNNHNGSFAANPAAAQSATSFPSGLAAAAAAYHRTSAEAVSQLFTN